MYCKNVLVLGLSKMFSDDISLDPHYVGSVVETSLFSTCLSSIVEDSTEIVKFFGLVTNLKLI